MKALLASLPAFAAAFLDATTTMPRKERLCGGALVVAVAL